MFIALRVQDEVERRRERQADDDGVRDESKEGRDEEEAGGTADRMSI